MYDQNFILNSIILLLLSSYFGAVGAAVVVVQMSNKLYLNIISVELEHQQQQFLQAHSQRPRAKAINGLINGVDVFVFVVFTYILYMYVMKMDTRSNCSVPI